VQGAKIEPSSLDKGISLSSVITDSSGSFTLTISVYKGRSYNIDLGISKNYYKSITYNSKITLNMENNYLFAFSPGILVLEYIA